MAGTRSLYDAVIPQETAAFSADAPLSALQTLHVRNNAQHLVDVSMQQRVHWCVSTGTESQTVTAYSPFVWAFPITNTDRNRYPSFDVRVAVRFTGTVTAATVTATLTDTITNTPIFSIPFSAVFTAATWYSDSEDVTYPWEGRATRIMYRDSSITGSPSAVSTSAGYIMGLFQVNVVATAGTGDVQLCGVSVREYLSQ